MMVLYFATGNQHKIDEVNALLPGHWRVEPISALGFSGELPENQDTLEGNAKEKVAYLVQHFGVDGFSEDTGLEIDALDGRPGVYSARYAGADKSATANMDKVLHDMEGKTNRKARFRTVVALHLHGTYHFFEGIVDGQITTLPQGKGGFGYDPIFRPDGYTETFGQLPPSVKQSISHRAKAIQQLIAFLRQQS